MKRLSALIIFLLDLPAEWKRQQQLQQERHTAVMASNSEALAKLNELGSTLGGVSTDLESVGGSLGELGTQLDKAKAEIIGALSNSGSLSPEVSAKLDELTTLGVALRQKSAALVSAGSAIKTVVQSLDDLNPDATPEPPAGGDTPTTPTDPVRQS